MKKKLLVVAKFISKSAFYLLIAMVVLITINEVSESDWFDPYHGGFWKIVCSDQIEQQADHDEAIYESYRSEKYRAISPLGDKTIVEYNILNRDNFYPYDYSYLGGKNVLAIQKNDIGQSSERYIYIGQESIRDPLWLGNDHVFFVTDCGTNCETIYLLDTNTKELLVGNISSVVDTSYREWQTIFTDWFGHKYTFEGDVNIINSENTNGKSYLIFEFGDGWGGKAVQKKFLFTESNLSLES